MTRRRFALAAALLVQPLAALAQPPSPASPVAPVVASSGSDIDATTCRVALRRGRFEPGLDASGRPVATRPIFLAGFSMPDG